MKASFTVILLCIGSIQLARSLKLTFTPSDDEQLPLSAKYRDSLRKLCKLIEEGRLPEAYTGKEEMLKKQCIKLAKDDANISSSVSSSFEKNSMLVIIGVAGAAIYYAYSNDLGTLSDVTRMIIDGIVRTVKTLFGQLSSLGKAFSNRRQAFSNANAGANQRNHKAPTLNSKTSPGSSSKANTISTVEKSSSYDPIKAREARLKRFAEDNSNKKKDE
jgi:hypothetical protein